MRRSFIVASAILTLAAAGTAVFAPVYAQTKLADPEGYRKAKEAATATFLDKTRSTAERLKAVNAMGYPDDAIHPALLAIGTDRTELDAIRYEALVRHPYNDAYLAAVLGILENPQDGGADFAAKLAQNLNRRITFTPPPQVRQRFEAVFRKLLDDKRDVVRLAAYRVLIANHDSVAVNRLAEGLRKRDFPIPLPEALDLLDQDVPVNHIATVRPFLTHVDPRVQARAARILAVDPESRPAIVALVRNRSTNEEVRLMALRALATEDPQFPNYAIALVADSAEAGNVRNEAMRGMVGRMNYNKVDASDQIRFAEVIEKLSLDTTPKTTEARKAQDEAKRLHIYLRKTFPDIQKHYQTR